MNAQHLIEERRTVFMLRATAEQALIAEGATRVDATHRVVTYYRPAPAFPGRWGACILFERSDGTWCLGQWILSPLDPAATEI